MSNLTWRQVAEILAERLAHQAAAAGEECPHPAAKADPDNCPFCADRAAYQIFQRKQRLDRTETR